MMPEIREEVPGVAQMEQADVQRQEQRWRAHVWGADTNGPCPVCSRAANIRQSCAAGRSLYDAWVRAAQLAYQGLEHGA